MREALLAALLIAQISETIEVRVTNIDVVVTDRSGKRVTGLTRDDFEVYENGKARELTNFYEVAPEGLPVTSSQLPLVTGNRQPATDQQLATETRQRRLVLFIDNFSIHPFQRRKIFESIDRSLDTLLRPGDEAMVVAWYRGLRIEQPFTADHAALRSAIARVMETGSGMTYESDRQQIRSRCTQLLQDSGYRNPQGAFDNCVGIIESYAEELSMIERHLIASTSSVLAMLGGMEGKKAMIYAGAALPKRPARELLVFADNLFSPYIRNFRPSSMSARNLSPISITIEGMAKTANANGVTVYMIDGADESRGVLPNAADNTAPDAEAAFTEYDNTAQAFQVVAKLTGGIALTHTQNFDLAIDTVARDLDNYYSLGYRQESSEKKERKVEVRVKNHPDYRVRSRRTYEARTVDEQLSDRVIANIYREGRSELAIEVQTGAPKKTSRTRWSVPLSVTIPSTLTLLPEGNELAGGFNVFIAVGDDNGDMSKVTRIAKQVRIAAVHEAELRRLPLLFTADLSMNRGTHVVSVAVVDQLSNASGYARSRVVVK
jgi:VWFA-related protein